MSNTLNATNVNAGRMIPNHENSSVNSRPLPYAVQPASIGQSAPVIAPAASEQR